MNKALSTLGICACARKISYGETLLKDIKGKKVHLVVVASDSSDNSKKKIIDKCNFYKCEYVIAYTQVEVCKVIARVDVVSAIGIKDSNLAKKLKENIEREGDVDGKKQ